MEQEVEDGPVRSEELAENIGESELIFATGFAAINFSEANEPYLSARQHCNQSK